MIVKFAAAALVPIVKFAVVTAAVAVAAVPASAARMSAAAVPASADRMSAAGRCRPSVHNIIFRVLGVQELHVHFFALNGPPFDGIRCWHGFHECIARLPWTRERKGRRLEQTVV